MIFLNTAVGGVVSYIYFLPSASNLVTEQNIIFLWCKLYFQIKKINEYKYRFDYKFEYRFNINIDFIILFFHIVLETGTLSINI